MTEDNCIFAFMCRYYDDEDELCSTDRRACNECEAYASFTMIVERKRNASSKGYDLGP
ncbi:MAG TPA: hypothetical protein VJP79_02020 [Nitrososphaera sp.]|nr:hypothetical protein [Nitrososphaera sp.]